MIKKIIKIKNVGRFTSYNCVGDLEFKKLNIIYSENGRGKTTLSNILRSLQCGSNEFIEGRKTLGQTDDPEIGILLDSGVVNYRNKKWDSLQCIDMEIFDSVFIAQNVCSGYFVDSEHKRGLYLFAIGSEGVNLASKYLECDSNITKINSEITAKKSEIGGHIINKALDVDAFVKLEQNIDVENRIKEQENNISVLTKSDEIKKRQALNIIDLPEIDLAKFESLLNSNLTTLLGKADERVKNHIRDNFDKSGERWLQYGLKYVKDNMCPFCKQDIKGISIIKDYKIYFSEEYNNLKNEIEEYLSYINGIFSQDKMLQIQSIINNNKNEKEFWNNYIELNINDVDFKEIKTSWDNHFKMITANVEKKKTSPIEPLKLVASDIDILNAYSDIKKKIEVYNTEVGLINTSIQSKKDTIGTGELDAEVKKLNLLKNQLKRYTDEIPKTCNEYSEMIKRKSDIEEGKKKTRGDLDKYTKLIFDKYERGINNYLEQFGAGFKISNCKPSFVGRKPSTSYNININNIDVELGSLDSTILQPSFKNTLSEGDKSTLALAFFLAKLELDDTINNKSIIFDDPISSLDIHRKNNTVFQILNISKKAGQVIVLTHDSYFARSIWKDNYDNKVLKVFCIKRDNSKSNQESVIDTWDIEKETQGEYYQNFFKLAEYMETGKSSDLISVVRCIRPLLEGNLRLRYPKDFPKDKWLGDFVGYVRDSKIGGTLFDLKCQEKDLEEINNYSKKHHHLSGGESEPINETELTNYIKRTIKLIGGVLITAS